MTLDASSIGSSHVALTSQYLETIENGSNRLDVREAAEALIELFGEAAVAGALENMTLTEAVSRIKSLVSENDNLSEGAKERINEKLDDLLSDQLVEVDAAASEAVEGSQLSETSDDWVTQLINAMIQAMANENDEENGGSESRSSGGGGGGQQGGENWLEALARGLAEAQSKWLTKAQEHLETMKTNAGADSDDTEARDAFVLAQSQYTASMQMFSMTAAATSTSLKSIGEGLSGIARKQ